MLTLVEQFKGKEGRQTLLDALRGMVLLRDAESLAEDVAEQVELVSTPAGALLIEEGATDNDLYFVLSGRLQLLVNNREYAVLGPGAHVGEFSLIDPGSERCATVCALEETVTAKLSAQSFGDVAERHPSLWHRVSQVLGSHLREGNRFLRLPNARPRLLFCASSSGRLFAQAILAFADNDDAEGTDWTSEIRSPEEDETFAGLQENLAHADLAVVILGPGELESLSEASSTSARDTLLLSCGISVGALGHDRTIIVHPDTVGDASPADVLGISSITYRLDPPEAIKSDLETICHRLQDKIRELGAR